MGMISEAVERWKQKKMLMKQAQFERRMQKAIAERELSSEERELMRYQEEQRQTAIRKALEPHREALKKKVMYGGFNPATDVPNIVSGQPLIFTNEGTKVYKTPSLWGGKKK